MSGTLRDLINVARLFLPAPSDAALAPDLEPQTMADVHPIHDEQTTPEPEPHCDSHCPGDCRWCGLFADLVTRIKTLENDVAALTAQNTALKGARP